MTVYDKNPHDMPHYYDTGDQFTTGREGVEWEIERKLSDEYDSPYYYLRGIGADNSGETKLIDEGNLREHYPEA